jgi:hypothetical protein
LALARMGVCYKVVQRRLSIPPNYGSE